MNEAVLGALREQLECYRRLAKLAEQQHEHVRQGSTDALLEVLAARQQELEQLEALERSVGPVRREWSVFVAGLGAGARMEAEGLMAESRRLLERIMAADRDDTLVLQQRKLSIGGQIGAAASAQTVNRNYAAAAYGRPRGGVDVRR